MFKKQLRKILRTAKIVTSLKLCHARWLVTNLSKPRAWVIMSNHPRRGLVFKFTRNIEPRSAMAKSDISRDSSVYTMPQKTNPIRIQ